MKKGRRKAKEGTTVVQPKCGCGKHGDGEGAVSVIGVNSLRSQEANALLWDGERLVHCSLLFVCDSALALRCVVCMLML